MVFGALADFHPVWALALNSYHFRQQLGGQVMDGFTQNAQGGQDENDSQDDTGSGDEREDIDGYMA